MSKNGERMSKAIVELRARIERAQVPEPIKGVASDMAIKLRKKFPTLKDEEILSWINNYLGAAEEEIVKSARHLSVIAAKKLHDKRQSRMKLTVQ